MIEQQRKNQRLIVAIFAMTILPFLIAFGLKDSKWLMSKGTNRGQLIVPPVPLDYANLTGFDTFSEQNKNQLQGHWLIVNTISTAVCGRNCLEAILKTRQLRLMLSKDLPRTRRVVLLFEPIKPEIASQLWLKDSLLWRLKSPDFKGKETLYEQYVQGQVKLDEKGIAELIGHENATKALQSDLLRFVPSASVKIQLKAIRKEAELPDGMLFLIDPMGNLMMQYEPGFDPYKVKDDLMHLLRISQIG